MPLADLLVLAVLGLATPAAVVLLWRAGLRRLRLAAAGWFAFLGVVLTATMVAHELDILLGFLRGTRYDGSAWTYDFRTYALHLLGAVLIVQGVRTLASVRAFAMRTDGRATRPLSGAVRAALVTLAVVVPLLPVHAVFALPLTVIAVAAVGLWAALQRAEARAHVPAPRRAFA